MSSSSPPSSASSIFWPRDRDPHASEEIPLATSSWNPIASPSIIRSSFLTKQQSPAIVHHHQRSDPPAPSRASFFAPDSSYFYGAPGLYEQSDGDDPDISLLVDSLLEPMSLLPASLVDDVDIKQLSDPSDQMILPTHQQQASSLLRPMVDPPSTPSSNPSYLSAVRSSAAALATSPSPSSSVSSSAKVCPFFLQGTCRYSNHCRYRHDFGTNCPQCGENVGQDDASQELHLMQCSEMRFLNDERRGSAQLTCGICFDNIVRSGRKFGLLQGCDHAFCLPCIRNWRGSLGQAKENLRACPLCRQDSHFVIPSDRLVLDPTRKAAVIDRYTSRLRQIECKWFARGKGTCPFGSSCFYAHCNEDGSIAEPARLQHSANADGNIEIMKPMRLSDFFG